MLFDLFVLKTDLECSSRQASWPVCKLSPSSPSFKITCTIHCQETFSHMPPRKIPYRLKYKLELNYPDKAGIILPSHGCGPRCKVDYDPNDDGPWTTLQIMRIDGDDVEDYACLMPRYYAIPLILINKQLAFYEAQCRPDGTPLPLSSSCGIKQRELREYSYLWHLRCRFLQAVFDMNHERVLNERWR